MNTLTIAKKEFTELISNRLTLVIIIIYLLLIVKTLYDFNYIVSSQQDGKPQIAVSILGGIYYILTFYGSFICIIIGFLSIYTEIHRNAITTLLVKPIYRDNIINGKLLGAFCFIMCIFGLVTALFLSMIFIYYGNILYGINLINFFYRLLIVLCISFIYVAIYFSLSVLLTILIKDAAYALIAGIMIFIIFGIIPSVNFAGNIAFIFGIKEQASINILTELSPVGISNSITNSNLFDPSTSLQLALNSVYGEISKLILITVISLVFSYIVFMRRDIR